MFYDITNVLYIYCLCNCKLAIIDKFQLNLTYNSSGGYFSNSLAIFTDASHMLIDFIGYAISLTAIWIAKRPASHRMTFGWYRAGMTLHDKFYSQEF